MHFTKTETEASEGGGFTLDLASPLPGGHLPDLSSCAVAVEATSRQAGTASFDSLESKRRWGGLDQVSNEV